MARECARLDKKGTPLYPMSLKFTVLLPVLGVIPLVAYWLSMDDPGMYGFLAVVCSVLFHVVVYVVLYPTFLESWIYKYLFMFAIKQGVDSSEFRQAWNLYMEQKNLSYLSLRERVDNPFFELHRFGVAVYNQGIEQVQVAESSGVSENDEQ